MKQDLAQAIHDKALECGFDDCGIVPIEALDGYKDHLRERLEKIPQSAAVYGFADMYCNPKKYFPWANSVIVCTEWYGQYHFPPSLQGRYAKSFLLSLATVPESPQHKAKERFEQWLREAGLRFEGGETNMPARIIPLREAAVAAGLGIFRKNNFFYGPKGSYYNLEGYLIDQTCEYVGKCELKPCAEKCDLCQKACKTRSLRAPFTMDPLSCVSFWTTFGGGAVPPHLSAEQFGQWIMGCDACQDACPYNRKHDWSAGDDFPGLADTEYLLQPENIIAASDEELIEKVIPKSDFHLTDYDTDTLRLSAERAIDAQKNR
ncbi:MAG: epoxyqueuosine reductase [Firmicutes bacterium]|nr:epoxyqueuosine reductase [Bacillota bacterium]